ncbi:TPA: hypothetical protein ACGOVI_001934 [Streptococcus suis]
MAAAFKKSRIIQDPAFIYIEWLPGDGPSDNETIHEIINEVDYNYFMNDVTIQDSLPYLTFNQTEKLFNEIRRQLGAFTLKKVSLANSESGKPSIEDEPYLEPFDIDNTYREIMTPLMKAVLRDPNFKDNSYDELASYFTDPSEGILSIYGRSLGLSRADLPYFPAQEEVEGALRRGEQDELPVSKVNRTVSYGGGAKVSNGNKVALAIGITGLLFGLAGTVFGIASQMNNKSQEVKLNYLNQELKAVQDVNNSENAADVFSRYFLTNYFTGVKEKITPFLADGDVKYTQPQNAILSSLLLEEFVQSEDGYKITYVVVYKSGETIQNERITFDIVKDENSNYGWVVVSEPLHSDFLTSSN